MFHSGVIRLEEIRFFKRQITFKTSNISEKLHKQSLYQIWCQELKYSLEKMRGQQNYPEKSYFRKNAIKTSVLSKCYF